ncbi:MAG: hypothetical protein J7L26_07600 [Candidatus Aminicenantes bacterium]|nr:hypothetical protein [Candidatus Aminicenantes bacterium]
MQIILNFVFSILGSIGAAVIIWYYGKKLIEKKKIDEHKKMLLKLGTRFFEEGLTKFHFSRDDYESTLTTFLDRAKTSISIISVSLKIKQEEGGITDIFRKKITSNEAFTITVSLINPNNQALIEIVAETLNISKNNLRKQIVDMLKDLFDCYEQLTKQERSRFKILVHNCFPMASVVMLDATETSGIIQIETKLYKASRNESFGFQITRKSSFFKRNYIAWQRVIQESMPIRKEDLVL